MSKNNSTLVPKLRFEDFEGEWEEKRLGEVSKIYDGTHQTPKYVDKGIPFYSVEHITANQFKKTKYITNEVFEKENKRVKLEKGDVLMTRIGDIGTSRLIDWNVSASFYVSLALIKSTIVNTSYLNQYITASFFQNELWSRTIHVAFPKKINLGEIGNCKLNIPTLPEQQKIASFLTSVDNKIQLLQQKKQALAQYKKGAMQQIFSQQLRFKPNATDAEELEVYPNWEEKKLGEVCDIKTGNSNRQDSGLKGKYTFFDRSQDIRTSDIFLFDGEAIIVAGEGQEFIPKYFKGKFDLHQRTYCIMGFRECNGTFLYYLISKKRHYFESQAVGSTVKSLRLPMFVKMKLDLPCLEEQQKIAAFLSKIDASIAQVSTAIQQTQEFKKGLLQQLFV